MFSSLIFSRYLDQKLICNCTIKCTCVKRNLTNVLNVQNHLPIRVIYRNIRESIWELNHTVVRYAKGNSHNYHICSNTFAHIPGINRTNVDTSAVQRRSPNFLICNHIHVVIKQINRTNAIPATNALRAKQRC